MRKVGETGEGSILVEMDEEEFKRAEQQARSTPCPVCGTDIIREFQAYISSSGITVSYIPKLGLHLILVDKDTPSDVVKRETRFLKEERRVTVFVEGKKADA